MKTIYVGNLNYQATEDDLHRIFEPYETVERVSMPRDSASGNTRGFAFVEMQDEASAQEAIRALNGSRLGSRTLVVNKARPRAARADTGRDTGERASAAAEMRKDVSSYASALDPCAAQPLRAGNHRNVNFLRQAPRIPGDNRIKSRKEATITCPPTIPNHAVSELSKRSELSIRPVSGSRCPAPEGYPLLASNYGNRGGVIVRAAAHFEPPPMDATDPQFKFVDETRRTVDIPFPVPVGVSKSVVGSVAFTGSGLMAPGRHRLDVTLIGDDRKPLPMMPMQFCLISATSSLPSSRRNPRDCSTHRASEHLIYATGSEIEF